MALFGADGSGAVADHYAVLNGYRVAAENNFARFNINAQAPGFDGGAAGVIHLGVVAENRHAGYRTVRV